MIDRLHLRNLKCFSQLSLPLAPLTLLTGFNAAGKSSALHGLLLLTQALREGVRTQRLPLNGPLVRLGTPGDVLREPGGAQMSLGVEAGGVRVGWTLGPGQDRSGHTLAVESIEWNCAVENGAPVSATVAEPATLSPDEAPPEVQSLSKSLTDIVFISAIRVGSSDVFASPDTPDPVLADVSASGEYASWWFSQMSDDDVPELRRHPADTSPVLRRQLNAWAGELFPGAQANAQRIPGTSLVRLELRDHEAAAWRRPANIGYGFSYAFPILVAGLLAGNGSTLVIDSPEAHLHPLGQSRIGAFLATLAASGLQVIVETHSDHVLNGVRLAVRDGKLASPLVNVHFFNPPPRSDNDPAHVVALRIDSNGNLSEWPQGFFDQSEKDLAVLAGWDTSDGRAG